MEGYHHPYHQHQHQMMEAAVGDRFPQWSGPETKEFLAVRAELDRAFMETKRNKALWEVMAARLREKGFNRSAEQCKSKWKNLVTRYKGCETMEPEAMRQQFPYYNELHAIFSARLHHMLWAEAEGSGAATSGAPSRSATGKKGKAVATTFEQVSSDDEDDDVEEKEYEYEGVYVEKGKNIMTRKGGGRKKKKKAKGEEGDHEGELIEVLEGFMREQEKAEARWREAYEAREEEKQRREETWRKAMEALEEERRRMERSWREREEQRREREEARSIRRDALITHLLNRLRRDDNI